MSFFQLFIACFSTGVCSVWFGWAGLIGSLIGQLFLYWVGAY